jgi:hypothetical protein
VHRFPASAVGALQVGSGLEEEVGDVAAIAEAGDEERSRTVDNLQGSNLHNPCHVFIAWGNFSFILCRSILANTKYAGVKIMTG